MQFRRWTHTVAVLALAFLPAYGCRSESERRLTQSVRRELEHGRIAADAWVDAASTVEATDVSLIAASYIERLRLGFGSPFRLIEYVQHDGRLADTVRARLSWALLARVRSGDLYEVDASVLDGAGALGVPSWPGVGQEHMRIVRRVVGQATDPRAAELALRLAYTMARAEALVSSQAPRLVAGVAGLLVDRALARSDADALLLAASTGRMPAFAVLASWRAARQLEVERPRIGPLPWELEVEAVDLAEDALAELRSLGVRAITGGMRLDSARTDTRPLIARSQLARLTLLAQRSDAPPETPVVVSARQLARDAARSGALDPDVRAACARFGAESTNEETAVIAYTRLHAQPGAAAGAAKVALETAVALRAYAQEEVWVAGMAAPGTRELVDRYGLASLTFDRRVPARWRPYYRHVLASALADLYRVMPATDLRGLRIHVSASDETGVLALHEPRTRSLVLPLATSAGTLAHELAHDIDWQVAVRKYRVRGDYATDRASRMAGAVSGDVFETHVRTLTAATLASVGAEAGNTAHARRPAEIFARGVDWYVSVALAGAGRRNGYLSSVQDELLTGYGTVKAPDVSGQSGDALMGVLAQLAPVYRDQRDAFRGLFGSARTPRSYDLARRIAEQSVTGAPHADLLALRAQRDELVAGLDGPGCGSITAFTPARLQQARQRVIRMSTEARARGLGLNYARRWFGAAGRSELAQRLYGAPAQASVEPRAAELAQSLARELSTLSAPSSVAAHTAFAMPDQACGPVALRF